MDLKKTYQFTIRIPESMRDDITKLYQELGFTALAEFTRYLMHRELDNYAGDSGQYSSVDEEQEAY